MDLSKEEDPEEVESGEKVRERRRRRKFFEVLGGENVDLSGWSRWLHICDRVDPPPFAAELRSLAWAGIPNELRPMAWQLLLVRSICNWCTLQPLTAAFPPRSSFSSSSSSLSLSHPFSPSPAPQQGYLPAPSSRRLPTLARKRQEYADAVRLAFSRGVKGLDGPIWHQISIDVPRTNSGIRLWQGEGTQRVRLVLRGWRAELTTSPNRSHSRGSFTCGRFDTQRRDTFRASTIWSHPSSRCSCRPTSVSGSRSSLS